MMMLVVDGDAVVDVDVDVDVDGQPWTVTHFSCME